MGEPYKQGVSDTSEKPHQTGVNFNPVLQRGKLRDTKLKRVSRKVVKLDLNPV